MKLEAYKETRAEMLAKLREMVDSNNFSQEDFDAAKKEVEDLDARYEIDAPNRANLDALEDRAPSVDPLVSMKSNPLPDVKAVPQVKDAFATDEYRGAFMDYVQHGTPIPGEFKNADSLTVSSETGAVIPTTLVHEIIREMKARGNVWNAVRKLNIEGGVEVPIADVIPEAHWVTEEAASDDQKLTAKNAVSFNYYGLECKLAQSLLVSVVTIEEFEELFAQLAVEAMIAALEKGVFSGTGSGQMLGILNDTRIPTGNTITLAAADLGKWAGWKKNVFAKMKKAYRNGAFYMAQSTFDSYIDGMVDDQGQPIGRVNYGIDGGEVYRFGGKTVETVEDDVIAGYDDAEAGKVFAVFVNLNDYAVNSNLQMTSVRWIDHDTNKVKNKVIMIADGKLLDPNGVLIIKKGA